MLSWLFKKKSVATNVLDKIGAVGKFVDDLHLSDAEKVESNKLIVTAVQQFAKDTLDENTERSKSRREIAKDYIVFYLVWCSVAFGIWPINEDYAVFIIQALTGLALGGAFTAIIIFYFGSHGLHRFRNDKK